MPEKKHHPRKRFGQHFLIDDVVLQRLITALEVAHGQTILEIGPGLGALTEALVAELQANGMAQSSLMALEIDRQLARHLQQRYLPQVVNVIQGDVLAVQLSDLIELHRAETGGPKLSPSGNSRLRLVGNLPYNISTPLIFHLLGQLEHIEDMLFMLQKEVAMRLAATPGNKRYGRLTVMVAVALDCQLLFDVAPEAFDPPPQVNSTVLRLTPKKHPLQPNDQKVFKAVVNAAFCQRRKTLHNALAKLAQPQHFVQANIDPSLRAEALSVQQYLMLADVISGAA